MKFFLVFLSALESLSDCLKLVGPDAPLVGVAGEDLVLPCSVQFNTSAVDMTVEWFRPDIKGLSVHFYEDRKDVYEEQIESYRGRTSLFKDELQKGNTSLELFSLRISDEGEYKCLVKDQSGFDDVTVLVTVEAVGSHPVITMESYDTSGRINLVCKSRGWYPEPQILWMNKEGSALPAKATQTHKHTEGFDVERHITVYDNGDSNWIYCRVQQKHHMLETNIIINSKVFDVWRIAVGVSVAASLIIMGLIITGVVYRWKEIQKMKAKEAAELQKMRAKEATEIQKKMEEETAEIQKKREEEIADFLRKRKKYAVDVTLDPDTAHPYLILSEDEKVVRHGDEQQDLPDSPNRFNQCVIVLGKQSFSSGRFYYEVQVRGKTAWDLGVCRESINRKGIFTANPQNGFWIVGLRNSNDYKAAAGPSVTLTLRQKPEKVGVFVDYEEGLVSFYDVENKSHIYSFTDQLFTEKLYPDFSPCDNDGGKNSAPLIISPVTH